MCFGRKEEIGRTNGRPSCDIENRGPLVAGRELVACHLGASHVCNGPVGLEVCCFANDFPVVCSLAIVGDGREDVWVLVSSVQRFDVRLGFISRTMSRYNRRQYQSSCTNLHRESWG